MFHLIYSKLSGEIVKEAIQKVLENANGENKRNFLETIELQIALKNYDQNKEKRFTGTIVLPYVPRPKYSVCVIGNDVHIAEAKSLNVPSVSMDDLKLLNKDKKKVKDLANKYHAFIASAALIRQIPRVLGPGLNKAGKFPGPINQNDNVKDKIVETQSSVKFQLKAKKALCMGVAVANVGMTADQVETNLIMAINFLVSLLPKNWQQVKRLYIKSTMGPAQQIYGL